MTLYELLSDHDRECVDRYLDYGEFLPLSEAALAYLNRKIQDTGAWNVVTQEEKV